MRRAILFLKTETGSTLVGAMAFVVAMLVAALALTMVGTTDATMAQRDIRVAQAFYLAEAGVERGQSWLVAQDDAPDSRVYPFGIYPDTLAGGTYAVWIEPDSAASRPVYTVRSVSTLDQHLAMLEIDVTPMSFMDYLYYVNRNVGPGGTPWFYSGETIDGPLHFNDHIGIWGDPAFVDHIQSSESEFLYANDGFPVYSSASDNAPHDNPTFQDGYTLGAPEIPWLQQSDLHTLRDQAGLTISGNSDVVFGRTPALIGHVSYSNHGQDNWTDVSLDSFNGIIYVGGNCHTWGIVDGQVTLCSNGQIDIEDDIVYYDSDGITPNEGCDDILGLAAGSKLNVVDNAANQNDCVIHGHILAINNQGCLVERHDSGVPRGTLTLHGGVAQDKWGPVGTGYVWEDEYVSLTGYVRDIHYDWRFQDVLPPGYIDIIAGTGVYTRVAWRVVPTFYTETP